MDKKVVEVTRMHRLEDTNGNNLTRAYCDVMLGGKITVKGVRVVDGPKGLFISMPQSKGKSKNGDTKWYPIIFINDKDLYNKIQDEVLDFYNTIE